MSEVVESKAVTTASIVAAGTAAANMLVLGVAACTDAAFSLTGTWVGTISFEGSTDGVNYFAISLRPSDAILDNTRVVSATANALFFGDVSVYSFVRARCSAFTSGTIVVKGSRGYR